jgi:hypothetical protein
MRLVRIVILALCACDGSIMSPGQPLMPPPQGPQGPQVGAAPLRRLTRFEYDNTVRDLLGDTTQPALAFPDEELVFGFANNSAQQSLSSLLIEGYEGAAVTLATNVTTDLPTLLGCSPSPGTEDDCVRSFLPRFGRRAYRRPLESDELDRLFAFYSASKAAYDFPTAVRMVVQAMLQSPHFLYRIELESPDGVPAKVSQFELATRLSYLLWGSAPDDALLDAAAAGNLDTAAQAERLLNDPRAHGLVGELFAEWLQLDKVGRVEKDATLFPAFTPDVRTLLRRETDVFTDDLVFSGGGVQQLLTAPYSFVNGALASYYGISGPTGADFQKVMLPEGRRQGLLTQASFLAAAAHANQTAPVQRGLFVRDRLLCAPPPPPPATVKAIPPVPDPTLTTRQRFSQHETDPSCAGCHSLMDPIGFGFEHYDAVGIWRDTENGNAVDATGKLTATDVDGTFDGALDLSSRLARSRRVSDCTVTQWFRFAYGRQETADDGATLDALKAGFAAKQSFRELLLSLTQSDAFLYRAGIP